MAEQNNEQTTPVTQQNAPATPQAAQPVSSQTAQPVTPQTAPESKKDIEALTDERKEEPKKNGRTYFIVALVCTSLSVLFFGLTFTPLTVYSLLASVLFCIASLSFLGTQKKRENFKGVFILTLITYFLFICFIAFFVGGVIWSMSA